MEGKIFLGGLTWQTTEEMLKTHFGKWGALNDVILMRNKITGEPRGFGFVQFQEMACGFHTLLCDDNSSNFSRALRSCVFASNKELTNSLCDLCQAPARLAERSARLNMYHTFRLCLVGNL